MLPLPNVYTFSFFSLFHSLYYLFNFSFTSFLIFESHTKINGDLYIYEIYLAHVPMSYYKHK